MTVERIPGIDGEVAACGPSLPRESFDTIMVSFCLVDGKPCLTMLAADDYGKQRQIMAEVGLNKAIYDYLKAGLDSIDRELLD